MSYESDYYSEFIAGEICNKQVIIIFDLYVWNVKLVNKV